MVVCCAVLSIYLYNSMFQFLWNPEIQNISLWKSQFNPLMLHVHIDISITYMSYILRPFSKFKETLSY